MALSVNVKLIENMANSHDGKVRVVKVISQYRIPGMTFNRKRMKLHIRPANVREDDLATVVEAATVYVDSSTSRPAEEDIATFRVVETVESEDVAAANTWPTLVEGLSAIIAYYPEALLITFLLMQLPPTLNVKHQDIRWFWLLG